MCAGAIGSTLHGGALSSPGSFARQSRHAYCRRMKHATAILSMALVSCRAPASPTESTPGNATTTPTAAVNSADTATAVQALTAAHPSDEARIRRGVAQIAALWTPADGDLPAFCQAQFVPAGPALDRLRVRMGEMLEQIDGHLYEVTRAAKWHADVDTGSQAAVDELWSAFDVSAHVGEDLFASKLAFVALLNFPVRTLEQKAAPGVTLSRREWAEDKLTSRFMARIPGDLIAKASAIEAAADSYIANYNLWMHHVLAPGGERMFPRDMRLITHWNLRDEGKANYSDPRGVDKQRVITALMQRIVTQTIPAAVINNPRVDWDPVANTVVAAPADTVETAKAEGTDATSSNASPSAAPEPDTRYAHVLARFVADRAIDQASPFAPTKLARTFASAGLPEARVRALLIQILEAPIASDVAAQIKARLGRPLEPFDLWYTFRGGDVAEDSLSEKTRKRYPTATVFATDMPRILRELGFAPARANYLAGLIAVDPSRGAGHAMPALRRGDKPRLRTRVGEKGMDYKGYNIAIHELGHNVEQVFSLYDVDDPLLAGVPNTAFTEALAFLFQARDRELLGLGRVQNAESEKARVLNEFWNTREIAGPALLELDMWRWLYEHPSATAAELRDATVARARELWAQYYAPHLGNTNEGVSLLGIYSHSISIPLYLFNYVVGHVIAFSVEETQAGATPSQFAQKFEAMARLGSIGPDAWLTQATGHPVRADDLLAATARALGK